MIVEENQEPPMHYHLGKMEDIINRGGGSLVIELYNSDASNRLADTPISVKTDGVERGVEPGEKIILTPGESISLEQGVYHSFYSEPGHGRVLVGEVSSVNDDTSVIFFYEPVGRFPSVEEDEEPLHLLVTDYSKFLHSGRI